MKPTGYFALGLLSSLLLFAGCNNSDSIIPTIVPADVSGEWVMTFTNADLALYARCSQDLIVRQGLSYAAVETAAGVTCTATDPIVVTQILSAITIPPVQFTCSDATTRTFSGLGTVSGTALVGNLITVSDAGWTSTELFTGRTTSTLSLSLDDLQIVFAGSIEGSCSFEPDLNYGVSITRTAPSPAAGS